MPLFVIPTSASWRDKEKKNPKKLGSKVRVYYKRATEIESSL